MTTEIGVLAHAVPTARAARGMPGGDRHLAVARGLAVGDVTDGGERRASEGSQAREIQRDVERPALAREVLLQLRDHGVERLVVPHRGLPPRRHDLIQQVLGRPLREPERGQPVIGFDDEGDTDRRGCCRVAKRHDAHPAGDP